MKSRFLALLTTGLFFLLTCSNAAFAQSKASDEDRVSDLKVYITQSMDKPEKITFSAILLTNKEDYGIKSAKLSENTDSSEPNVTHVLTVVLRDRLWGNNKGVLVEQVTEDLDLTSIRPDAELKTIIIFEGSYKKGKSRKLKADEQTR